MAVKQRKIQKQKVIGSVTTVTFPEEYNDFLTGKRKVVTEDIMKLINKAAAGRDFVHLVMTGISLVEHNLDLEEDDDLVNRVLQLEKKVNEWPRIIV